MIPSNNRCCGHHLIDGRFSEEALGLIQATSTGIHMTSTDLGDWLLYLTNANRIRVDFSKDNVPEEKYKLYTGLQKNEFEDLFTYIEHGLRISGNREPKNALGMFLCLMRLSIPQKLIAELFDTNQPVVSACIDRVSELLETHFLPMFLGYSTQHMTRADAINKHGSPFYNNIFDQKSDTVKIAVDGTYLFTEKPGNFEEQRKTYSGQKHRNLVKLANFF